MPTMINAPLGRTVRVVAVAALVAAPLIGLAQGSVSPAGTAPHAADERSVDPMSLHMIMTPTRHRTAADSARAATVAATLRKAIVKYRDTTAAVADGYKMFAPEVKEQKIYHFSNRWLGFKEAFRFDPAKPTSILYRKASDGHFELVGAMYVAPKKFGYEQLDARIPLSIARWHAHVNWCLAPRGEPQRWLERKNGLPVFGPDSPIATRAECDAVHGRFYENPFGWMVHAMVLESDDPKAIWGDDHAGHDMHEGMHGDMHEGMKMDSAM